MSESIYNLIPAPYVQPKRPPRYKSRHDPTKPVTGSTFGTFGTTRLHGAGQALVQQSGSFGPAATSGANPKNFLKRGQKTSSVPSRNANVAPFRYASDGRKPTVPRASEKPVFGLKTAKNFITANAVEAILQVPRVSDNEQPDYINKADYGRVPAYLAQVKDEISRENDMIDQFVREQMGTDVDDEEPQVEQLGDEERDELVHLLKTKWDAVNGTYQRMCHQVKLDTHGKVVRKETMERQLEQLEADIRRLEAPGPVYVS